MTTTAACSCALCLRASAPSDSLSSVRAADSTGISGTYYVDSLLAGADRRWNVSSSYGTAVNVTYSFMAQAPSTADFDEQTTFQAFTQTQKDGARRALALYAEATNLTFTEVTDSESTDVRFANCNQYGVSAGYAYYPGGLRGGQVWLASDDSNSFDMSAGSYGYSTMIHEIGHAVGLKHPGNYNAGGGGTDGPYLPAAEDNNDYSVMSYNSSTSGLDAISLMLYDIAALQFLYGANTSTRSGDSTYTFGTTAQLQTIWDGGGTDVFDASNQTVGAVIDLRAGGFSSIGLGSWGTRTTNNVAIAYGVTIENAVGTAYADTITGNSANNRVQGGAGNDTINGGTGDDVAVYGSNRSAYTVTQSGDTVTVSGPDGTDILTSIEFLAFADATVSTSDSSSGVYQMADGGGSVTLSGYESIVGGSGNDWVTLGDSGNTTTVSSVETLLGGAGSDRITLGAAGGRIVLTAIETLTGGSGGDWVDLGNRGNTITLSGIETLQGGSGGDWVTLGDGGNTTVLAAIETLVGGAGRDWIYLGNRGNTTVLAAIETLVGGSGGDWVSLGNRGNTTVLTAIETLVGGSGIDMITLGHRGNTTVLVGIEVLIGGTGSDVISLGNRGNTMSVSNVDTLIGGTSGDLIVVTGGSVRFQGGGGADILTLRSEAGTDDVVYTSVSDGSASGESSGSDSILNFQTGTDRVVIAGDLRARVDADGDGTVDSTELLALGTITALDDSGFASLRPSLQTVAADSATADRLAIATADGVTGLFLVSGNGDGAWTSAEVRLLGKFSNVTLVAGDFAFA